MCSWRPNCQEQREQSQSIKENLKTLWSQSKHRRKLKRKNYQKFSYCKRGSFIWMASIFNKAIPMSKIQDRERNKNLTTLEIHDRMKTRANTQRNGWAGKTRVNKQRNWCQQTAGPLCQTKASVCSARRKNKSLYCTFTLSLFHFVSELEFTLWVKSFKTPGGDAGRLITVDCPGKKRLV